MRFDTEYANAAAAFDACVSYVDRIMESSPGNDPAFRDPRPTFGWKCHPNRAEKTIKLRMPHGDLSGVVKRWPDADYTFHVEREEIPDSYYNSSDRHALNIYTEHDLASKVSPDLPFDSPNTVQDLSEKESGDGAWEHASEHPNDAATTFAMDVFSRDVFEYIDDLVVDHAEIAWDSSESVYRIPESVYHN